MKIPFGVLVGVFSWSLFSATMSAQSAPQFQISHTTESLRGVSAVSRRVAWASGTHGTYLRTVDGGKTWVPARVPDAGGLDFRAVVAFDADQAFLMSAGPGEQSRIYHTSDAGRHWQLQFSNTNPKGFFDSMVFWDRTHGVVLGDPIPDESGQLRFEVLLTEDGQSWHQIPSSHLPSVEEGEGAFAASNTCLAILSRNDPRSTPISASTSKARELRAQPHKPEEKAVVSSPDPNIWFATGGKIARVFHSPDRGQTWQVADTPILHGTDSAGIFSVAFRDALHGVIAGGDYKRPEDDGPNLAFTEDGGRTWSLSPLHPLAYFSAVACDRKINQAINEQHAGLANLQSEGKKSPRGGLPEQRLFLVAQNFILDFRSPSLSARLRPGRRSAIKFNAVSPYPDGGALIVGTQGAIASVR